MGKILFVNASLTDGGSERVMSEIANGISEKHEVTMVLLRDKPKTYHVNSDIKLIQLFQTNIKFKMFIDRIKALRRIIITRNPDYVVAFMDDIVFYTIISCIGLNKKLIISVRNNPLRKDKKFWTFIGKNINNRYAYRIVFQTEQARKCFDLKTQKKGVVIPNPIREDLPEPWCGKRDKSIIAAGRFTEQKNFEILIRAFARLNNINDEYKLIIYGEGTLRDKYQNMVNSLNLKDYVFLPGYIPDLNLKMRKAGIYVSSSNFEGISNSMLEALAMGIPSICTDCPIGGAALAIQNNVNGMLIPVDDEDALYNAICQIISDEEFANFLSKNAIDTRKKFAFYHIIGQWNDLFEVGENE